MSDTNAGTVRILTFKEGLLSKVAHDLQITATRFSVSRSEGAFTVTVDPKGFVIDGAVRDGQVAENALKPKDKADILRNIHDKVLKVKRNPEIRFSGRLAEGQLKGDLTLAGKTAPLTVPVDNADGHITGRVELKPSRWGVAPFKAMLGAIKVKDSVVVTFDIPTP